MIRLGASGAWLEAGRELRTDTPGPPDSRGRLSPHESLNLLHANCGPMNLVRWTAEAAVPT